MIVTHPARRPPSRSWSARGPQVPDRRWDVLLLCVACYVATDVGRVHQLWTIIEPLRLTLVAAVGALVLYALDQTGPRSLTRTSAPTTRWMLLFVGWAVVTVPMALHEGAALQMVMDPLLKSVLLYLLVVGVVRGSRDVSRLVAVYVVSATAYATVTMMRLGWPEGDRPVGMVYYDANDFAAFAVTAAPLAGYFAMTSVGWWRRVLAVGAVLVCIVGVVWSSSRGAFVALSVVLGAALVLARAIPATTRVLVAVTVAATVAVAAGPAYWERMATLKDPSSDYNVTDPTGRLAVWRRALQYTWQRPLYGVGANNFQIAEGTLSDLSERQRRGLGFKWSATHNSYLQVAAELGVPGLILFLGMFGSVVVWLWPRSARPPPPVAPSREAALSQALLLAIIGYLVGAFFLSLAYASLPYVLIALAVAQRKVTTSRATWPAGGRAAGGARAAGRPA